MCFTHVKQKNTAGFPHIFYLYIIDLLFTESDSLLLLPNTMFRNIQYICFLCKCVCNFFTSPQYNYMYFHLNTLYLIFSIFVIIILIQKPVINDGCYKIVSQFFQSVHLPHKTGSGSPKNT